MKVEITLPKNAELAIKPPKKINFNEPLFKTFRKKRIKLSISKELKVQPEKIYNYLKKLIGENVEKDEIIAEKKGLLMKKVIKSPVKGRILEINHLNGTVLLETEEPGASFEFKGVQGEVLEKRGNKLILELKDCESFKIKRTNFKGLLAGKALFPSSQDLTLEKVKNRIIFKEKLSEYLENKLLALQAKATVTLYPPSQNQLPFAQLANVQDFKKICEQKKKYALIDAISKVLYIYN